MAWIDCERTFRVVGTIGHQFPQRILRRGIEQGVGFALLFGGETAGGSCSGRGRRAVARAGLVGDIPGAPAVPIEYCRRQRRWRFDGHVRSRGKPSRCLDREGRYTSQYANRSHRNAAFFVIAEKSPGTVTLPVPPNLSPLACGQSRNRDADCLNDKESVEQQHDRGSDQRGDLGEAAIGELTHDVSPSRENE